MRKTYQDRMYDRQHTLELRIKDAYSATAGYQSTFAEYLERMGRIFNSKQYLTLPNHRRQYLRGMNDVLFSQLQNSFVWVLIGPDGVKYGPGNDEWLEHDTSYKENMHGAHVWPTAWANGEYRVFDSGRVDGAK